MVQKFYADRGPHLAAMIAYFALLSFVPLTFLSLALLGLTGRADESSFLVREIKKTLPGTPIDQIVNLVHAVQDNAATLGIVGGVALLWTSLSLFSVLESALNIVYGRPNRSFLRGKGLAVLLMVSSLVTLFVALLGAARKPPVQLGTQDDHVRHHVEPDEQYRRRTERTQPGVQVRVALIEREHLKGCLQQDGGEDRSR